MRKNKKQFRQGDVLIERVEKIPNSTKQLTGLVILAQGEATGHSHSIDIDDADAWKRGEDTVAVVVKKRTEVKHQEHAPIPLRKGNYKVIRQREYSPEAIRNVAD